MAINKEVSEILKRMEKNKPTKALKHLDMNEEGIRHVLIFLSGHDNVPAGDISRQLGISTARVAVLIRKMQEKGLILKETDPKDARKAIICLTDKGKSINREMHEEFENGIAMIVEKVGAEKINQFLDIADEIKAAIQSSRQEKKQQEEEHAENI